MSENELMIAGDEFNIAPADASRAAMQKMAERSFLPFVQLSTATSDIGKKGKVTMGEFALMTGKDSFEKLGDAFEATVYAMRPRACRKTVTGMTTVFNMDDPEYQKIQAEADAKKLGSWYGLEFLIWLRTQRRFATFHASNATARGNSAEIVTVLTEWDAELKAARAAMKAGQPLPTVRNPQVFFRSFLARGQGQEYWAPKFGRATTPFSELPDTADVIAEVKRFTSPKKGPVNEAMEAGQVNERG